MPNVVQHSKKSVEWYTPPAIVESARLVMGGIDLDPACSRAAADIIKPKHFLTCEGLTQSWGIREHPQRILLNPPGGDAPKGAPTRSNAVYWWSKLAHEYAIGNVEQAIFVGFSIEVLQAAQCLDCDQPIDFPFCVPRERIKFLDERTLAPARMPGHANVLVYLPPRSDVPHAKRVFRREFFKYGRVVGA